jgi:alkylated DNA nucleotide flippase Atl1
MQLDKPLVGELLDGAKTRYQIPLYQRTFDWDERHFEQLWTDLLNLAIARRTAPDTEHFLGTLVLDTGHQTPNEYTFLVVDGQQRLTTLTMLLAALRDVYRDQVNDMAEEIHEDRLIHRRKDSRPERFRLWPTQGDRKDFIDIIEGEVDRTSDSNLVSAYLYFLKVLRKAPTERGVEIDEVRSAALDGLRFVSITAETHDNVYAIFESLNNTGLKLTQGDLLRNYFFSRLGGLAESVYESFWYPMQERLSRDDLAHLFWLDLTWSDTEAKKDDTFKKQTARVPEYSPEQLRDEVRRFNQLSILLEVMRLPSKENDPQVRRALQRLADFGIESIDPLVLGILRLRQGSEITGVQTSEALGVIESFLVRRLIVRAPHNALSRILMRAYNSIDSADPAASLRDYFSRDNKDFASDEAIREAVTSVNFYRSGTRRQQKTLLAWLEGELVGNEPASLARTSIEHVLPQRLTDAWRNELGKDVGEFSSAEAVHETYVHTLANLTLSGYNSKLSNRPFSDKRDLLIEKSNIELNKWIVNKSEWRRTEIVERGSFLSELIARTWVGPTCGGASDSMESDVAEIADALAQVPVGKWVSHGDLADETGLTVAGVKRALASANVPLSWRVMGAEGRYSANTATGAFRSNLENEGVQFDTTGAAMPSHRWSFGAPSGHAATLTRDVAGDVNPGPIGEFLDEAANRLAPSVSAALDASINAWLAESGRVLLGVDSDEHEVLTAVLYDDDAPVAELRLTPSNGLWLRVREQLGHELVDADTAATLATLTAGS